MNSLEKLEQQVHKLYDAKDPDRTPWTDWLATHHVFVVADYATELAERLGGNAALARAGALLHDIADVRMHRHQEGHEQESLKMARELMRQSGFSDDEVKVVVDDAIRLHSCRNGVVPETTEGKILATADALAHLQTDFYIAAIWLWSADARPLELAKQWAREKIERDYHVKIQFDEIRQENQQNYELLKNLFSR